MEAEIIRSLLAGSGIPVQTRSEAVGKIYGLTTGPLAEVEIWVPASYREIAAHILGPK